MECFFKGGFLFKLYKPLLELIEAFFKPHPPLQKTDIHPVTFL